MRLWLMGFRHSISFRSFSFLRRFCRMPKRKHDKNLDEPLLKESKDVKSLSSKEDKETKSKSNIEAALKTFGSSWQDALKAEFAKPYFLQICTFVANERSKGAVYPTSNDVFTWTTKFPINETKVVILGQDPYHGAGQAHGLSFSVPSGIAIPPSLVNIYKELERDPEIVDFKRPSHGNLTSWADQGVLMLNSVLTVNAGKANSHKGRGWEKLTDAVIRWISRNLEGVVFLLWGLPAQKKASVVDPKKHHILKAVHPSPLSAHKGFIGCGHFSKCNNLLVRQGKDPIDWSRLS